jgi:hypothetical protein
MKNKIFTAAALAAALALARGLWYGGMDAPEVVRKLSSLRLALALYSAEHNKVPPPDFADVLTSGKLEAVPELKLRRHFKREKVRNVPTMEITDSGGWVYVNNPRDKDFGLAYIDCSHKDEKGRFWSEF